jgi:uncharacterized protein (TIGR02001 family)
MQSKVFTLTALAAGLMAASGMAHSQFSSTITATSDYDFRGVSLSARDPALQASADYAFPFGLSVGAWASNIDSGDEVDDEIELDLYVNYAYELSDGNAITAGLTWYVYPDGEDTKDYPEAYVGFNSGGFAFKQWYTNDNFGSDQDAYYTEANYTASLSDSWSLGLHAGYSWGDYWDDLGFEGSNVDGKVADFSIAVTYSISNINITAKVTGTDASGFQVVDRDVFNNEPRALLSVATTLPWGE